MRKSFVNVKRPMLAGVVKENTAAAAEITIANCLSKGATGIDLHLSTLEKSSRTVGALETVIRSAKLPVLALNYNLSYDGTFYEDSEEHRTALLLRAVKAGAAAVDIQGYTFDLPSKNAFRKEFSHLNYSFIKDSPKEVVVDSAVINKQMEFIEKVHFMGAEVLLSNHVGVPMTAEQLVELALFVEKREPDIIKIVAPAESEEQMLEAFRAMVALRNEVKTPVSYHCSGKFGALTRVINPALGGFMCFCNERYTHNSDTNQPLIETAKAIFENLKNLM